MAKVFKIGITENNNKKIKEVDSIKVVTNKGIVGDRHFKEFNDPYCQITLIESEGIDHYNIKYGLNISYVDFRRNIITSGIQLNNLVGKKILVGDVSLEVIDLCRPCKHLCEILDQNNIIKEFIRKGGVRCQILSTSKITIGDEIKVFN